ncbi:hypothetical protein MCRY_07395 [Marivita cryptomonadis]|nr:hypothetical protein MCRY_07395 [Marivita cryptomonadis]
MREIHEALPDAALNRQCLRHAEIGIDRLGDFERMKVRAADRVTPVPIEPNQLVAENQSSAIGGGLAQAGNEIDRERVIVIVANLQARLIDMLTGCIQNRLTDLPVRCGVAGNDAPLGHIGHQGFQSGKIGGRQAGADQNDKVEIGIGLRLETGQAQVLEQSKALLHPVRRIEKGLAVGDAVVFHLETALGGVGKPTENDGLHGDWPCVTATARVT